MTLDHSFIEELMAVDALDGLDDDDRALLVRERAGHGDCADCRAIEREFAEVAAGLAFTLPPEPVDESMADRVLASPRQMPGEPLAPVAQEPPDELAERRARRPRVRAALVAAVAAALALVAVATLVPSTTGVSGVSASQRIVTFEGQTEGTLAMAYTPGEPGAVFWGSDLPDPGPDMVYEIWMIDDGKALPGACFTPTDGVIALSVDADIGTTEAMAVTTEPSVCPEAPTTPPILTADLTTVV